MVSLDHLLEALRDVGLHVFEVYDVATPFYPWAEDAQETLAEVIIRPGYLFIDSSPVGFRRGKDGRFKAVISSIDRKRLNEQWIQRLTERYNHHVAADGRKELLADTLPDGVKPENGNASRFRLNREPVKLDAGWRMEERRRNASRPKKFVKLEPELYSPVEGRDKTESSK